jgi:hypothetical protein
MSFGRSSNNVEGSLRAGQTEQDMSSRKQRRNRMQQPSHDSSPAGQQMQQQDGQGGGSLVSFAQQGGVEGSTGSVSGDAKSTLWRSL